MMSGASATSSAAGLRALSALPVQRTSIRTSRPSTRPKSRKPRTNAARRACASASSAVRLMSTPMRRIRSGCCACAANGQDAADPAINLMNWRRLIVAPRLKVLHRTDLACQLEGAKKASTADVRFGSKADICSAKRHVPLPPKADMCGATRDAALGQLADIALLDHLVGAGEQ